MSFDQLRRRLHESLESIETLDNASTIEAILRERSRELAAKHLEAKKRSTLAQVIIARRCDVLIAVPIESTGEVRRFKRFDLPGATEVVTGVFQVRGRTHCLVDPAPLIGDTAPTREDDKPLIMLISGPPGELGLEIDEVLGARAIYSDEIAIGLHEQRAGFISHVTRDLVHVIDTEALMALPEVRIGSRR